MSVSRELTPLGAVARGLAAGVIGTAAMTAAQTLPAKLAAARSGDGGDEAAGSGGDAPPSPADPWERAPTPAKVARRIIEGVLHREVAPERIPLLTNAMHWSYGTGWGAVYGLLAGSRARRGLGTGLGFGAFVWAMSYAELVPMGLYEPPWTYPPKDTATEIGYHLAYGAGTAAGFKLLGG